MQQIALVCHPSTPSPAVRGIEVHINVEPEGTLTLLYQLDGDMRRIRIPPPGEAQRKDGLWRHTCFEAFLKPRDGTVYREFNFAPSTEWAAYAFRGYREGMRSIEEEWLPIVTAHRAAQRLEVEAVIRAAAPLRLALAAVIEEENGTLSYWALGHPAAKPDFHHPDSYTLTL